jgi:hypothetical protein
LGCQRSKLVSDDCSLQLRWRDRHWYFPDMVGSMKMMISTGVFLSGDVLAELLRWLGYAIQDNPIRDRDLQLRSQVARMCL